MKTIGLSALLLSTVSLARAATFDFTGSIVQGSITINGDDITSIATSSPQVIGTENPATIENDFSIPSFNTLFEVHDDDGLFFVGDRQVYLNLVYLAATEFVIEAGSSFVMNFDFALGSSAQLITGFELVPAIDSPREQALAGALSVSFNTADSVLTLSFAEDFTILDMENLGISGRFLSTVPEPASGALLLGAATLAGAVVRRRRR